MLTGDMGNVQQRLARLERSNRRWRRVTLLVACAGALLLATFPQAAEPGAAARRGRAAIRPAEPRRPGAGGHTRFHRARPRAGALRPRRSLRLRVGVEEAGPGLHLLDARGAARASLALFEGEPGFVLYDGGLKVRAVISMAGDQPSVVLLDENKRRTFRAP